MRRSIPVLIVFMLLPLVYTCQKSGNAGWTDLFNGSDLTGWVQRGGKAVYSVDGDMIIGTSVPNTENSFLCTERSYGDFILEIEVMVDTALNSGIQIRSNEYQDGRVYGYQVEIDPSPGRYSGGIYDEARRGWLYDLSENEEGREAFINGTWNKYRIEAVGNNIKTWINGISCANLIDEADDSGFISLQVHSINAEREPWTEGMQVKWRNIRILKDINKGSSKAYTGGLPAKTVLLTNNLSPAEAEEGWMLLFDGQTTRGWRRAYKEEFPDTGWIIENGSLTVQPSGGAESAHGGDIVTSDEYSDFDLKVDFKMTPGANSGIKYFVTENEEGNTGSAIGLEYQILDDNLHPDAGQGRDGNRTLASLYDLIPAGRKHVTPTGQWNMARIICRDNHVEHWLNGSRVLEYERSSKEYRDLVAISKYKVWENFGEAEEGHILLQDHGDKVSFRNIKILDLNK